MLHTYLYVAVLQWVCGVERPLLLMVIIWTVRTFQERVRMYIELFVTVPASGHAIVQRFLNLQNNGHVIYT